MPKHNTLPRRTLFLGIPAGLLVAGLARADTITAKVRDAQARLSETIRTNDAAGRAALYLPDGRSLPEYQPPLFGPADIAVYHRAVIGRKQVKDYTATISEVIDLGGAVVVTGTLRRLLARQPPRSRQVPHPVVADVPDAEDRGRHLGLCPRPADPQNFYVAMPEGRIPATSGASAIKQQLDDLNRRNAEAVRGKDAETQIGLYTEDAIFMPFADTPKSGKDAIAAHLRRYVENGSGAIFDTVEVWNEGFEVFAAFVVEYARFRVRWRADEASGVATGGGIRLWKRMADGQLKMHRQIGTHYYQET